MNIVRGMNFMLLMKREAFSCLNENITFYRVFFLVYTESVQSMNPLSDIYLIGNDSNMCNAPEISMEN